MRKNLFVASTLIAAAPAWAANGSQVPANVERSASVTAVLAGAATSPMTDAERAEALQEL